ncbi:hypothetical protein Tco_1414229 [Tanacetum coccineum]
MEEVTFEQIMDEVDSKTQDAQENAESPYDTKSEIKIIKYYQAATISNVEEGDASESFSGLRSMHDDDLASMTGFETQNSADHVFEEDALKDTLPQLIKETIKSSVLKSIVEELPQVEAHVQKNLQDQLPNILMKPMYKDFNTFNKLES